MNLGAWPDGVAFDPAAGVDSLELEAIISGPGTGWSGVLLGVGARAHRSAWGARTAIAIAERWASTGRRVILADLHLERPELHEHLGESNGEGLADVFLFGASLAGVTHRSDERNFDFLPPGAYVPDAEEVYASAEWDVLLHRLRVDGTLLLAYAPVEAPGVERLAGRLGNAIVLAVDPESLHGSAALEAASVQLVLRPAAGVPLVDASEPPPEDEDEPGIARRPPPEEDREAIGTGDVGVTVATPRPGAGDFERVRVPRDAEREALIADLRQRQREAMLVPAPAAAPEKEEVVAPPESRAGDRAVPAYPPRPPEMDVPPTEPDFAAADQPRPPRREYRRNMIVALIVVAILSGIAGAWRLISGFAEQRRAQQELQQSAETEQPAAPEAVPTGTTTALGYSVALEAHSNLGTALERVDALRAETDEFSFYLTPVLVDGALYYRLMSGPVADSATAARMMAALVAAGHKTGASELDIRETPLTFQLGVAASRTEAERRVDDLRRLGIPAYIVMDEAEVGIVYRVYGGAYTAPAEAEIMREMLRTAGQPDSLVTRRGRTPQ